MAHDERPRSGDEDEFEVPEDEGERGIADDEAEFDEDEGDEFDDEGDGEDEEHIIGADPDAPPRIAEDRSFTAEIGDEGGSQGDLEKTRDRPRVMRGSEATTTAVSDERTGFHDRHEGGGIEGPRE